MSSPRETVQQFCDLMATRDAEQLRPLLAETSVYHNAGLPATHGADTIVANLASQFAAYPDSYEYVVLNIVGEGDVVLTERLDMIRTPAGVQGVPVMGTFVVKNGLITRWTDYWDTSLPRKMMAGEDVSAFLPVT